MVIAFTVETDGRLPTGESLEHAIKHVDELTQSGPVYYVINCAHPNHFDTVLTSGSWVSRIGGMRVNASKCSHAELDEAKKLDDGNPEEFGQDYRRIVERLPNINVSGGCCGTDIRHITAVCEALKLRKEKIQSPLNQCPSEHRADGDQQIQGKTR